MRIFDYMEKYVTYVTVSEEFAARDHFPPPMLKYHIHESGKTKYIYLGGVGIYLMSSLIILHSEHIVDFEYEIS